MSRRALALVMLFALFWQSVALARVGSSVNVLADYQHAALHWQEEAHHHHDDGSYHLDHSDESSQHMAADVLGATLALAALPSHHFPALGLAAPAGLRETRAPNPTLDGLLRPPRSRA